MRERDDFWSLVEGSAAATDHPDGRLAWLIDRLAARPVPEVVDFAVRLDEARRRADTWPLWAAARRIRGGRCSDDGFHHFQAWLVGLGRQTFERVVADPDALADVPQVRRLAGRSPDDWAHHERPDWECLGYVADTAYERLTREPAGLDGSVGARGVQRGLLPDGSDDAEGLRDPAVFARRFPRLAGLFPLPGPVTGDVCQTATS
ncbi:DUF4240 domain-containing protein [Micromonospora sp. WMMD882]|uniref:DUF4240 domain-containing protein n=1 Tax=Micromonospora sp. WMMD882 TaxID=3015151 RepID=UPI00248D1F78|nr:DUF4240 domain-containing protein [Micromonospora sp. WMMD882]WBB79665.1 DUF4240 domain-containing protein [Micromonospora sp. WMMD882]